MRARKNLLKDLQRSVRSLAFFKNVEIEGTLFLNQRKKDLLAKNGELDLRRRKITS